MTYTGETVQPEQDILALDILYLCSATFLGRANDVDYRWQGKRNIWIDSGSIDIYSSNSKTQPTQLSDMTLNTEDTNVTGIMALDIIPRWIYIDQNTGTSTEIVSTGIDVESKGAFA